MTTADRPRELFFELGAQAFQKAAETAQDVYNCPICEQPLGEIRWIEAPDAWSTFAQEPWRA
jgi:hypothetical protein